MKQNPFNQTKISFAIGVILLMAMPSWSQNVKLEIEQKPLPELPNSISGTETVQSRMKKFIREQGLEDLRTNQKDENGRMVLIDTATAPIAASPSDPEFVNARIIAFKQALLNAKSQCAQFQKTVVATNAIMTTTLPSSERAQADAEQLKREGMTQEGATKVAQALNVDLKGKGNIPQVIQTAALYGEKILNNKMSEEIRKKGLDPNKPIDEQVAKTIAESGSIKDTVSTLAASRCTGLKVIASFEQNPSTGQGSVGIVTVWSEMLHGVADAIVTNNWILIPKGLPGNKISEHIPDNELTLLTMYGTQIVRDEKGDYVLLAYAQAQPRTINQQSVESAYKAARLQGYGLIRSFLGESIVTNGDMLMAQDSTVFTDASTRYQNKSSFTEKVEAVGEALAIAGVTMVHDWEALHPATNGKVVGVVMQWRVDSAKMASVLASMNKASGAKIAEATRASNPVGGGATSTPLGTGSPASKSNKSEAYQGQGKASRDF